MTYIFIHLIHLSSIADSAEGGNVIYNRNFTGLSCRDRTFPISAGKARDVAIVLYCIPTLLSHRPRLEFFPA